MTVALHPGRDLCEGQAHSISSCQSWQTQEARDVSLKTARALESKGGILASTDCGRETAGQEAAFGTSLRRHSRVCQVCDLEGYRAVIRNKTYSSLV